MKRLFKALIAKYSINRITFFLFLILCLCIYPVVRIVINSTVLNGQFSLGNFATIFQASSSYVALINTTKMVGITLMGAWTIGMTLAFIREKTDFKYKKALDRMVFLSFTTSMQAITPIEPTFADL